MNASSEDDADLVEEGERLCKSCYNHELPLPLSASSFDLRNEWAMDVPLPTQLLLEGFINENTIKKLSSDSHHKYLQKHTERLYLLYDTLLNTFNSYHHGLMQKVITDNLIMNFHSISSLLELTNKAGLTTCYKTAETTVQTRAQENTRNYETFLKTYPLTYQTIAGIITNHVNLRQCHPVLMLDNLVRLKTKEDPDPGGKSHKANMHITDHTARTAKRSHHHRIVAHNANICDATPACACKKELQLTPDDVESALLTLTDEENRCISKTQNLMRFGCASLWHKIQSHIHDLRSASKNVDNPGLEPANEDENYGDEHLNAYVVSLADTENIDDLMTSFEVNCIIEDSSGIDASDTDNTSAEEISSCSQEITKHELQPSQHTILETFGLHKTNAPELLTRRPPPVAGRDDDITKLKEILDDMLLKLGYNNAHGHSDRILCGPDNKICSNLLTLMERDKKYKAFLPEFPILHLRKSKINTILSAYKDSGFGQLLRFMRDESSQELSKIIGLHHIDVATRHIKRLGQSLHVAFLVKFLEQLSEEDQSSLLDVLSGKSASYEPWSSKLESFMEEGSKNNATFALHRDWMTHCDEVVALQLAERLGGKDGYLILLATVKSSLLFQFLNGASSYAPFCVDLLHEYYKCGSFHQGMKHSLFSTPIGKSNVNFSTDTKREMEHIVAIKMLRAGSTEASVLRRMAIIDSIQSVPKFFSSGTEPSRDSGEVNWNFTDTDVDHILPTAKLILRRGGLGLQEDHIPHNVYARNKTALNPSILDEQCRNVGEYMLKRYIIKKGLFGCKQTDLPNINTLQGPTDLVQKAKLSKGTTLRRTTGKVSEVSKSEHAIWEEKRQKALDKRMKEENRLTSKMNTCQALVEPSCSKPRVNKSSTMPRALKDLVEKCPSTSDHLIALSQCTLPSSKCDNVQYVTVEVAGTKFKTGKV